MKKIFSIVLAAFLMLLGTQAFAQTSVNAGYINSTQTFENSPSENSNGFYAGVSFNIPIAGGFGIAPGLYYSMIGNETKNTLDLVIVQITSSSKLREHAINLPVYLNWNSNLARDAGIFVYGGPTLQYGLSSKYVYSEDSYIDNYEKGGLNRFNVYRGGGVGFNVSNLQITVGYDYGMMNLYDQGERGPKSHRSNLKLGVGFAF